MKTALYWYEKAANQNYAAQCNLGTIYYQGDENIEKI